jgi:hypothetical protein
MRRRTPIGTYDSLYYVSYQKFSKALGEGLLTTGTNSINPWRYAAPDAGFLFRFPFPDEDELPFGDIGAHRHNRTIAVTLDAAVAAHLYGPGHTLCQVNISQQKLIHRKSDGKLCLALVCEDPADKSKFRMEEDSDVSKIIHQIVKHHLLPESDAHSKAFYRSIAARILKGYRIQMPGLIQKECLPQQITKPPRKGPHQGI